MDASTGLQLKIAAPARGDRALSALLPPALFTALFAALCALSGAPFAPLALFLGAAAALLCALLPKRAAVFAGAGLALAAAGAFALPAVRAGAKLLANRLFAASEAANAYAYRYFDAADDPRALRAALCCAAVLLGLVCCAACRRRWAALLLFLGVAFLEAYFGVTPGLWRSLLLFAALFLALGGAEGGALALPAGFAAVALAVLLLIPRPSAAVEAYSEGLRDELGRAAMGLAQTAQLPEAEPEGVRAESSRHAEEASADPSREQARRGYALESERERELAPPRRFPWLRAALWLLLSAALLLAPFLPFALLDRAKRRAAARRAAFDSADNAAAIRAMFIHTVDWLRAGGLDTENRPFAQCGAAAEALISPDYAARYEAAAEIWEEAAYSRHEMSDGQRRAVRELMEETERTVYARAGRRERLRLKYAACLCEV